jgi:hypothetical protein
LRGLFKGRFVESRKEETRLMTFMGKRQRKSENITPSTFGRGRAKRIDSEPWSIHSGQISVNFDFRGGGGYKHVPCSTGNTLWLGCGVVRGSRELRKRNQRGE